MKKAIKILALILIMTTAVALCSCSKKDDTPESTDTDTVVSEIAFDEEEDGAVVEKVESTEDQFYGTWTATSEQSSYLYGNITITIKEDGTWEGNITDTDMNGTWVKKGNDLFISGEYLNVSLAFTKNGNLVMQRNIAGEGEEDMLNTVLTKE